MTAPLFNCAEQDPHFGPDPRSAHNSRSVQIPFTGPGHPKSPDRVSHIHAIRPSSETEGWKVPGSSRLSWPIVRVSRTCSAIRGHRRRIPAACRPFHHRRRGVAVTKSPRVRQQAGINAGGQLFRPLDPHRLDPVVQNLRRRGRLGVDQVMGAETVVGSMMVDIQQAGVRGDKGSGNRPSGPHPPHPRRSPVQRGGSQRDPAALRSLPPPGSPRYFAGTGDAFTITARFPKRRSRCPTASVEPMASPSGSTWETTKNRSPSDTNRVASRKEFIHPTHFVSLLPDNLEIRCPCSIE